ncbi:MAG: sugar ABC transporter permease [Treponema sp.]|jgi:raffinose/stachyose/melibiose transport system permease protein|nr:sugar ABC transporter permease [Treponema sp.]
MTGNRIITLSLQNARRREVRIASAAFLFPALFFLAVFIAYPIIDSFITSTTQWSGISQDRKFIGLDNWKQLIMDRNFRMAFGNNVIIMFMSLLFQVPFALALATFLDITGRKGFVFKVVWFLPYLISSVAIGILFKFALDANYGLISSISKLFGGGSVDLLGRPGYALFTVIGVVCWQYIPFYMVLYLAAYGTIPVELYEAACIDGATRGQYFRRISLPLLKPTIISGATISIIGSLKYFDLVFVMTGGGPGVSTELMATMMYKTSFVKFNMGYGAAVACGMFLLITIIAMITITALNKRAEL